MKTKRSIIYTLILVIGVLVLINILANRYFFRLDFTDDQRYTLSDATENILDNLEQPVTVTAYFSEDLPARIMKNKREFKDLLIEYSNRSRGKVVYEFVNPNKSKQAEQKAMQNGIRPVMISVRDKDQMKQQRAFLGAVIRMGDQKETIPFIQPGTAMEYELSSNIKKLSVSKKPKVGYLQGHGEPSYNSLNQVQSSLAVLYDVEEVYLDKTNNLDQYRTIAIVAPSDSFPRAHLEKLDRFLAQGKNLFVALNRVKGNFQRANGSTINTGLETWLKEKGITVQNNFVIDANCASVSVRQQQGPFNFTSNISFPYFPILSNFAEHPITDGLESVVMQLASSLSFNGDSSLQFTPIAKTSEKSGTRPSPTHFNIQKQWGENDFPLSKLTVAGVLSGPIVDNANSQMVVVGDGDFPVNGEGQGQQQVQPDNINMMVNSIDYLSDETGLINLRTKGITSCPLKEIKDSKKTFLKYLNFFLPVLIIIFYGIFRFQRNRIIRTKRMEEGYV